MPFVEMLSKFLEFLLNGYSSLVVPVLAVCIVFFAVHLIRGFIKCG